MPNLFNCSSLLNSFQQFISFVICFLVSRTIMEFKEWNLDMASCYGDFNLITLFHFQYSTPNPIIFGYNNLLVNFFMCARSMLFFVWFHIHPTSFLKHIIEFILIGIPFAVLPTPCPLECSNLCFVFDYISHFIAFFFPLLSMCPQ
jgi:hypothetical protein